MVQGVNAVDRLHGDASIDDFQALLFQHARWAAGEAVRSHRESAGESAAGQGLDAEVDSILS
ncbi:MAG: hypothetical protein ACI841_000649 [Planctomycetota bacterium]|jgi:hypothetical protein